ncbi:hypothetical protein OTK49_00435 [Vibrio coralliirubri]|uniref:hypothetical protein n=1 Tax=Vibrio coralliirubri TaxID=1516159 RepID=UPI0022833238|nr:hypothetical protein [Vibrio coralliirubri]MCY9861008.1 hypothetical protein [Vibrio coralliirubri]
MANHFFLDQLFDDTEQSEVVVQISEINRYFVLRVSGLSYTYTDINHDLALVQWRFLQGKLVVEDAAGVWQFTLLNHSDRGMIVEAVRGEEKKVVHKFQCFFNILKGVTGFDLNEFESSQVKLTFRQRFLRFIKQKDITKNFVIPFLLLICTAVAMLAL